MQTYTQSKKRYNDVLNLFSSEGEYTLENLKYMEIIERSDITFNKPSNRRLVPKVNEIPRTPRKKQKFKHMHYVRMISSEA